MSHNENDEDLKKLLKPLRDLQPNDIQMQKWQKAIEKELVPPKPAFRVDFKWALQLAVATLVGFIVGALLFRNSGDLLPHSQVAQISLDDATFERSHDNLD